MARLLKIMARLRRPGDGCPWDLEQTIESIKPNLIEEAYEALDAMESGNRVDLAEELGDLLLQIIFQAQIAAEEGTFNFADVAQGISDKLVRRHPHIFGDVKVRDSKDVLRNWDAIKKTEKRCASPRWMACPSMCRRSTVPINCNGARRGSTLIGPILLMSSKSWTRKSAS